MKHIKKLKIAVIFPACDLDNLTVEKAAKILSKEDIELIYNKERKTENSPFRYDAKERAKEINKYFKDKSIDAIICARGGYGSHATLPFLDLDLIKKNSKPLIGYSDNTALINYVSRETKQVTYHGPNVKELAELKDKKFINNLKKIIEDHAIMHKTEISITAKEYIRKGKAEGEFIGGNLTLVINLVAAKKLNLKNKILFLEDVDEEYYRLDRMFTTLVMSGEIFKSKAIIFGNFTKITNNKLKYKKDLKTIFSEKLKDYKGPIIWNYPLGHKNKYTIIPISARAVVS